MPIHDWSRVDAGIFHDFHQAWTIEIRNALNGGRFLLGILLWPIRSSAAPFPTWSRRPTASRSGTNLGGSLPLSKSFLQEIKADKVAFGSFVAKAEEMLLNGINLVVADLFPPSSRDPQGIHKAIWDRIQDEPFELPADKQLTIAAYFAGKPKTAYVEPVAVGDMLPSLPIFLDENTYVPAPLEATYQSTWAKLPDVVREFVLTGIA